MLSAIRVALKNCLADMRKDKMSYILGIGFIVLIVCITYYNWNFFLQHINSDIAGENLYFKKVFETKNPFTVQYANSDESFFSRAWFVFVPIYFVLHDFILSAKLTLLATTAMIIFSAVYLFKKLNFSVAEMFLALIMIFGFFAGKGLPDYMSYLPETVLFRYFNSYSIMLCGILITVAFISDFYRVGGISRTKKFLGILISAYFGLSGVKMLCLLYIPILLVEIINVIRNKLDKGNNNIKSTIYSLQLFVVNLTSLFIFLIIIVPYRQNDSFFSTLHIIDQASFGQNVSLILFNFLRSVGISFNGSPLLSVSVFLTACSIVLYCVLAFGMYYVIKLKIISDSQRITLSYLVVSIIFLAFYFIFTGYPAHFHYWFIAIFTIPIVAALCYRLAVKNKVLILKYIVCILILSGVIANGFYVYGNEIKDKTPIMEVTDYLVDKKCENIVGPFWYAHTVSFLSNAQIKSLAFISSDNLNMYDWITDRTFYVNNDEPIILILDKAQEQYWLESPQKSFLLSLAKTREEVSGYILYDYAQNPFGFNTLKFGYSNRFNYLNLLYTDKAYLANGGITLVKDAAQYGPYCQADVGAYEVTVRGENLNNAVFDVVNTNGQIGNEINYIIQSPEEIKYAFTLTEDVSDLEMRTFNYSDNDIVVRDITLEKQNAEKCW